MDEFKQTWTAFAAQVVLEGNPKMPGAHNLTMGHVVSYAPIVLILLLHPRKWFGLSFLPFLYVLSGVGVPFLPAEIGEIIVTPPVAGLQGRLFGGDPYCLIRLSYWYNYVTPLGTWGGVIYVVALIGNVFVFLDRRHWLHGLLKFSVVGLSLYFAGKCIHRIVQVQPGSYKSFLDNVLNEAVMEHPTVSGDDKTVSGSHVFFDVIIMVLISVVHVVLEAPSKLWTLLLGPAGSLVVAVDDSVLKRGRSSLAGVAYLACAALSLHLWLPHQMEYSDKVWTGEAYAATRGAAQKVNEDIKFCFINTPLALLGVVFTAQRLFADSYRSYSFFFVQYFFLVLTMGGVMQIAFTTSCVLAFAKFAGPNRGSGSSREARTNYLKYKGE